MVLVRKMLKYNFIFPLLMIVTNSYTNGDEKVISIPYHVEIFNTKRQMHHCAGAIINEDWILTAATCVLGQKKSDLRLITGESARHSMQSHHKYHEVSYFVIHSEFDYSTAYNNIALIKLENSLDLNSRQYPVRIRSEPSELEQLEYLQVSGFGVINKYFDRSPHLQSETYRVVGKHFCQKHFLARYHYPNMTDNMFCAGKHDDYGQGDLGSPAIDTDGQLVGILSWSPGYFDDYISLFTNVMKYRSWIIEHM